MKRLAEKRWARALAALLFAILLLLSAAASVLVRYGRADGWYYGGRDMSFERTNGCLAYVIDANYYVEQNVRWTADRTLDYLGSYAGTAYSYQILDEEDRVLADTTTENSVFVSDDVVDLQDEPSFTVRGYVNLPVEPYGGCYTEYAMFTAFFAYRYLLLSLKILLLLLTALMLVILCLGAAQRGRAKGLIPLLRQPYDLFLLAMLVVHWIFEYLFNQTISQILITFSIYAGTWPNELYWAAFEEARFLVVFVIVAFSLWYLSGQIGAGLLRKNLAITRFFPAIPPWVFLFILLGVHAFLVFLISIDYYYGGLPRLIVLILYIIAAVALIVYVRQARQIRKAAEELASGNLTYKTDTSRLHFVWKQLGTSLNRLGDGMARAVEDQMRSERMKTELITNVSHDLKTPLTSIINYVDFLKSDGLDETTRAEYLAILEKQSARLKKLTEDVLEASKAASGAVSVNSEPIDAAELLGQFLGEYAERFAAAGIEPVLTMPERETVILADSILLGRVIDNLITNVLKYAMPGTRAYIDLTNDGAEAAIVVKNVSREPLNISADELMERFVRGDSSRHSEGSGLGLSIARSLTELMGGRLDLVLDGDLFKAVLTFPVSDTPLGIENETGAVV